MGPYPGGQAEYVRVPFVDFNALVLPPGKDKESDYVMLADIFPTGWHGCKLSGLQAGESIVVNLNRITGICMCFSDRDCLQVFGAGPVGLLAAYSAKLQSASDVYVVDRVPERLQKAREIGCHAIDFTKSDPVEQILSMRNGKEVDRGVDAVGYQAVAASGKEQPNTVLSSLVKVVRATGGLGIPGLYVPSDPGAPDADAALGMMKFPFGKFFEKGLSMAT